MSKKKLNGNEINKISAGGNAKDVGYGTLGTVALTGGVAMLGHVVKDGIRKDSLDGWGKGWTIFHTSAATIAADPAAEKEAIVITDDEAELTIEAEATVQLKCATAGVTYATSSEAVATVSDTGLVTGVARGKTTIEVYYLVILVLYKIMKYDYLQHS